MNENERTGFFEEEPGSFSMTRLITFLISMVPLSVWTIANLVKLSVMATSKVPITPADVSLVPIPETVLGLIISGFTLKWAQKRYGEDLTNIIPDNNEEKKPEVVNG